MSDTKSPSLTAHTHDLTLALFAKWVEDDAKLTPEEREQERLPWEQSEESVNETREAAGMRRL